jgi:hypothetical protein
VNVPATNGPFLGPDQVFGKSTEVLSTVDRALGNVTRGVVQSGRVASKSTELLSRLDKIPGNVTNGRVQTVQDTW